MTDPHSVPDRYRGRPLMLILENYVLAAIGELSEEKRHNVASVVQYAFGGDEDWMRTVREKLSVSDNLDDELRRMWDQNRNIAAEHGLTLEPFHFAQLVVDQNFAPLIDRIPDRPPPDEE